MSVRGDLQRVSKGKEERRKSIGLLGLDVGVIKEWKKQCFGSVNAPIHLREGGGKTPPHLEKILEPGCGCNLE